MRDHAVMSDKGVKKKPALETFGARLFVHMNGYCVLRLLAVILNAAPLQRSESDSRLMSRQLIILLFFRNCSFSVEKNNV